MKAGFRQKTVGNIMKTDRKQLAGKRFLKSGITLVKPELCRQAGYP